MLKCFNFHYEKKIIVHKSCEYKVNDCVDLWWWSSEN